MTSRPDARLLALAAAALAIALCGAAVVPAGEVAPRQAAPLPVGDEPAPAPGTISYPLEGPALLLDTFGESRSGGKRSHEGVDMMADRRTPVVAAADGVVSWAHDDAGGRCCALEIRHDDGWRSRYIHLDNDTEGTDDGLGLGIAPGIAEGARVRRGQLVGWVGDSGNAESCNPHLHFELRTPEGSAVDAHALLSRLRDLPRGATCAWTEMTRTSTLVSWDARRRVLSREPQAPRSEAPLRSVLGWSLRRA